MLNCPARCAAGDAAQRRTAAGARDHRRADAAVYSARKAVRRLNKVSPHIKTEVIPDADHALTMEQTELVDEKILGFLKP